MGGGWGVECGLRGTGLRRRDGTVQSRAQPLTRGHGQGQRAAALRTTPTGRKGGGGEQLALQRGCTCTHQRGVVAKEQSRDQEKRAAVGCPERGTERRLQRTACAGAWGWVGGVVAEVAGRG